MSSGDENNSKRIIEPRFYGASTVGERGQIVIPAEARKRYGIETGDKLLIMGTPDEKGLWLGKIDDIRAFHNIMTLLLENIQHFEHEHVEEKVEDEGIHD